MAIQTTQTMAPQPVKNNKVNQSMRDAIGLCNVGSAKAAKLAIAGSASSKVRSDAPVHKVATMVVEASHRGSARWRLMWRVRI